MACAIKPDFAPSKYNYLIFSFLTFLINFERIGLERTVSSFSDEKVDEKGLKKSVSVI